jgi:hypothetical protein
MIISRLIHMIISRLIHVRNNPTATLLNQSTGDSHTELPEDAYTAHVCELSVCQYCVV